MAVLMVMNVELKEKSYEISLIVKKSLSRDLPCEYEILS